MKKSHLLIFLLIFSLSSYARSYTISGFITDSKSGETLISASVVDIKSGQGTVSNTFGFYSLTISAGNVNLQYSYVGYEPVHKAFQLAKDTVININLNVTTNLKELTVYGTQSESGVRSSQMSAINVPIEQIKTVPTLFGETDVLKTLQLLPGVKGGTEGTAGIYVRGGGPDENLFLLDGVPVYNVNHMAGFFSAFNSDALKDVTLYKGSFPARFNGRLSSVVDIRMKDGDEQNYHGKLSIGLISSKFSIDGPIIKGKTTFSVSGRRTYGDLLLQPFLKWATSQGAGAANTTAGYYFYDLNAKLTHKFSERDRLYLSFYEGDDVLYGNIQESSSDTQTGTTAAWLKLGWKWGNLLSAIRWNHVVNNKLFMNTTVSYTRYRSYLDLGTEVNSVNYNPASTSSMLYSFGFRSNIEDFTGKVDFDYFPNPNHDIKFGISNVFHVFQPGVIVNQLKIDVDTTHTINNYTVGGEKVALNENIAYIEDNFSLLDALKANIGFNYSGFAVQNKYYPSLQPRLSIRWLLNDKLSLKAGYAYMSQYIHLLSNNAISLPTDLWVPATKRIPPMSSQQVSAGVYYNLFNLVNLSVEGYYKTMNNLIAYKDGASFFGISTGWEDKVSLGRGWAYGVEFLAQKTIGKTTGWVGYTWAKTERLFDRPGQVLNNGLPFPDKYDRRNEISIVVSHKFNDRIDIAGTWIFSSGNYATLAMQEYAGAQIPETNASTNMNGVFNSLSQMTTLSYISSRNNYRFAPYHRLDLGVNFHKKKKHGIRTWNISIFNAYDHLNPFMVYPSETDTYNPVTGVTTVHKSLKQLSVFPVLPSISYSFKF